MNDAMARENVTIKSMVANPQQGQVFWATTFGLLCGCGGATAAVTAMATVPGGSRGFCSGTGWADVTLPAVPPANHSTPSSVVHTRREPGNDHIADKIVMAHSRAIGSNQTFVTIAAHTGSTLFHSHAVDATSIVNFWWGGARFLGAPGKHDNSPDHANHVVLQRNPAKPSVFPQRNISDMLAVSKAHDHLLAQPNGRTGTATPLPVPTTANRWGWTKLMLPVRSHLPMLDQAGAGVLLRNFSALGFSCDNWQNETVTMTIMPVVLYPVDVNGNGSGSGGGGSRTQPQPILSVDDFESTSHLWPAPSNVVREPTSPSGYALELRCTANTTSCGAPDPKKQLCPVGCMLDNDGWCQSVMTSFANRKRSAAFPLPTEAGGHGVIHVEDYDAANLVWRPSDNYKAPPHSSVLYPIGMQTTRYTAFSNKTYHYFGNEVRSMLGYGDGATSALQTHAAVWAEGLGDGEFYPTVTCSGASVKGDDLGSLLVVKRGFYTQRTGTTRQVYALREGPVIVVDTVVADADADGFVGGPSWAVVTGADLNDVKQKKWKAAWARVNRTVSGKRWHDFAGFQDQLVGGLNGKGFLVVIPELANAPNAPGAAGAAGSRTSVGITQSSTTPTLCAAQACALYPAWYVHGTQQLREGVASTFVSILYPHDGSIPATTLASGVTATWQPSRGGGKGQVIAVEINVGGKAVTLTADVATPHTDDAESLAWNVLRK